MIAIIDNGEGYEDHDTWLVEVESREHAIALVASILANGHCSPDLCLIAVADSVEWFSGSPRTVEV